MPPDQLQLSSELPKTFSAEALTSEGATFAAVSVKWLTSRLAAGTLPGRKVGHKWFMTAADVSEALDILKNTNRRSRDLIPAAVAPSRRAS